MAIKLYWHRGSGRSDAGQRNFGDYLSPLIVEAVSGRSVKYAPLKEAEMMAIGTILANSLLKFAAMITPTASGSSGRARLLPV
ncbi:hypothetical protein [Pseudomonas fluvialis]|uniref:hypothetical protein n=1 Tax=Pseudomonas fluvialis TaxID=1793966 RepID=UPI0035B41E35